MANKPQGYGGLRKGGQLQKDIDALSDTAKRKKRRAAQSAKTKKKLAAAFPPDESYRLPETDMDRVSRWQIKAADLRKKAKDVRRSGNKKAAATYEQTATEYLARVRRLRAKMGGKK